MFSDRSHAGRVLADELSHHKGHERLVLALPRGGVPVAWEVARAIDAPLDVFGVRKLGVPGHPELAMGAVASGGVVVLNQDLVAELGITDQAIADAAETQNRQLVARRRTYSEGRPAEPIAGRYVIVVDDGLATGSSMMAAISALRRLNPSGITIAVPTAPLATCTRLKSEVTEVVCASNPRHFQAVGQSYADFTQVTDEQVIELLQRR